MNVNFERPEDAGKNVSQMINEQMAPSTNNNIEIQNLRGVINEYTI